MLVKVKSCQCEAGVKISSRSGVRQEVIVPQASFSGCSSIEYGYCNLQQDERTPCLGKVRISAIQREIPTTSLLSLVVVVFAAPPTDSLSLVMVCNWKKPAVFADT